MSSLPPKFRVGQVVLFYKHLHDTAGYVTLGQSYEVKEIDRFHYDRPAIRIVNDFGRTYFVVEECFRPVKRKLAIPEWL